MIFKRWTMYRHINKSIMVCVEDRDVAPEIYRQYSEIQREISEPGEPDHSYNVKAMIEKNTGITDNEPVFTGIPHTDKQWSKSRHRYLTHAEIAHGEKGG